MNEENTPQQDNRIDDYRRKFLRNGAATIGMVTLAPGVLLNTIAQAKPDDQAVSSDVRWGMLIDTNKCESNCSACVDACNKENGLTSHHRPETDAQWIRKVTVKDTRTKHSTFLPLMCQHCEHPPCVDVCPTGASFRRADGIVMVDRHTCIGCRYCMMACPYKARSFIHESVQVKLTHTPRGKGCVESCNFCVHRLDNGQTTTACQDACVKDGHQAIVFGDLRDPNSAVSMALANYPTVEIRADLKLNTGVRYTGL